MNEVSEFELSIKGIRKFAPPNLRWSDYGFNEYDIDLRDSLLDHAAVRAMRQRMWVQKSTKLDFFLNALA